MEKLTGNIEVDTNIVTEEFFAELAGAWIANKVRSTERRAAGTVVGLLTLAVAVPALGAVVAGTVALGLVPLAYNAVAQRVAA